MKEIKIMVMVLSLSLMYQFTAAQNKCKGNKVLMSIGPRTGCGCTCIKKCVSPAEVQTYLNNGWRYGNCWGSCCWIKLNGNSASPETTLTEIHSSPATGSTNISFSLSQTRKVSLKVFDMNDQLVSTLADKIFEEGKNELMWNTENVNKGVYFLQFQSETDIERVKLLVTK